MHIQWKETKSILITWSLEVFKEELIRSVFYCLTVSCTSVVSSNDRLYRYQHISNESGFCHIQETFMSFRRNIQTISATTVTKMWNDELKIFWFDLFFKLLSSRSHVSTLVESCFQNRNLRLWGNLRFLLCLYCIHVETRFFVSIILNNTHSYGCIQQPSYITHVQLQINTTRWC